MHTVPKGWHPWRAGVLLLLALGGCDPMATTGPPVRGPAIGSVPAPRLTVTSLAGPAVIEYAKRELERLDELDDDPEYRAFLEDIARDRVTPDETLQPLLGGDRYGHYIRWTTTARLSPTARVQAFSEFSEIATLHHTLRVRLRVDGESILFDPVRERATHNMLITTAGISIRCAQHPRFDLGGNTDHTAIFGIFRERQFEKSVATPRSCGTTATDGGGSDGGHRECDADAVLSPVDPEDCDGATSDSGSHDGGDVQTVYICLDVWHESTGTWQEFWCGETTVRT